MTLFIHCTTCSPQRKRNMFIVCENAAEVAFNLHRLCTAISCIRKKRSVITIYLFSEVHCIVQRNLYPKMYAHLYLVCPSFLGASVTVAVECHNLWVDVYIQYCVLLCFTCVTVFVSEQRQALELLCECRCPNPPPIARDIIYVSSIGPLFMLPFFCSD